MTIFIQMLECEFADEMVELQQNQLTVASWSNWYSINGVWSSSWWDSSGGKKGKKAPETTYPEDDSVFSLKHWDKLISAGDFWLVQRAEATQHLDVAFSVDVRHRGGDTKWCASTNGKKYNPAASRRKEPATIPTCKATPEAFVWMDQLPAPRSRNHQINMKQRQKKWRASLLGMCRRVRSIRRGVTEECGFSEACFASLPSEWRRGVQEKRLTSSLISITEPSAHTERSSHSAPGSAPVMASIVQSARRFNRASIYLFLLHPSLSSLLV